MPDAYRELEKRFQRIAQLDHAMTFLQWDQLVMMPPAGNEARARALAEMAELRHERMTAPQMGDLIREAREKTTDPDLGPSLVEMERAWRQAACLSAELVKAKSLAGSRCEHAWRDQRRENDWPGFLKNFREVVRLSRKEAQARQAAASERFKTPYDALLDLYSTGADTERIRATFDELKRELPGLLEKALDRQPGEVPDLAGNYRLDAQEALSRRLMTDLGFDFRAGRLDVSMHPFSTGGRGDQRITTRFRETDFVDALQGTAHETGHASYEAGLPEKWEGLPAGRARDMSIHESQSLLFEKHLFLCRPFTEFFSRAVHEILPDTRKFDPEQIWSASVRVRPGLIRIEADEICYPLHVILRFEIESALINGTIEAEEIPDAWNEKMERYLGLSTKGNDADGCLQDIHWTDGSFGYFPSYTLGALNAAQFSAAIRKTHPDWRDRLGSGDVGFVRAWLAKHVWSRASLVGTRELIQEATGEPTNPAHFLAHLKDRYLEGRY